MQSWRHFTIRFWDQTQRKKHDRLRAASTHHKVVWSLYDFKIIRPAGIAGQIFLRAEAEQFLGRPPSLHAIELCTATTPYDYPPNKSSGDFWRHILSTVLLYDNLPTPGVVYWSP